MGITAGGILEQSSRVPEFQSSKVQSATGRDMSRVGDQVSQWCVWMLWMYGGIYLYVMYDVDVVG